MKATFRLSFKPSKNLKEQTYLKFNFVTLINSFLLKMNLAYLYLNLKLLIFLILK
jgi:hypothetical protein